MTANLNDMDEREVISYCYKIGDSILCVEVGKGGVARIKYHTPQGEGDKHFVDVYFDDGNAIRDFDIVSMSFKAGGIE